MILTVTPNPMLDKTLELARFNKGEVHRAERMRQVAGGKGLNAARALAGLGESTLATGFLGGETGRIIRRLLDAQHIPHHFVEIAATTREGFTFIDRATTQRTAVFEPGSRVQTEEVETLKQFVQAQMPRCRALALCGSMPCEGFDHLYADLITMAHAANVPVFLDSYLAPLQLGLKARPHFLKPNREEARQTFGLDMREPEGARALLQMFAQHGAQAALLTDAERPLFVHLEGEHYRITPPAINCRNPLGGGDVLVAAFLYGWGHEMRREELLRFAVAAGTVNAMHDLPGYAEMNEIRAMMKQVEIEKLAGS